MLSVTRNLVALLVKREHQGMNMKFLLVAAISALPFLLDTTAWARDDSLRCGTDLISLEDTMYEVKKSCGEPHSDKVVGEKTSYRIYKEKRLGVESVIYVSEWVYERNDGIYVLTFEGSRLVAKEFIFQ